MMVSTLKFKINQSSVPILLLRKRYCVQVAQGYLRWFLKISKERDSIVFLGSEVYQARTHTYISIYGIKI